MTAVSLSVKTLVRLDDARVAARAAEDKHPGTEAHVRALRAAAAAYADAAREVERDIDRAADAALRDAGAAKFDAVNALLAEGWTVDAAYSHVEGTCDQMLCGAH